MSVAGQISITAGTRQARRSQSLSVRNSAPSKHAHKNTKPSAVTTNEKIVYSGVPIPAPSSSSGV